MREHTPQQYAGPSILDLLWKELMEASAILYEDQAARGKASLRSFWRGRAEGLAAAIAIMQNPYSPSMDSVRAEVVRRWRGNQ